MTSPYQRGKPNWSTASHSIRLEKGLHPAFPLDVVMGIVLVLKMVNNCSSQEQNVECQKPRHKRQWHGNAELAANGKSCHCVCAAADHESITRRPSTTEIWWPSGHQPQGVVKWPSLDWPCGRRLTVDLRLDLLNPGNTVRIMHAPASA